MSHEPCHSVDPASNDSKHAGRCGRKLIVASLGFAMLARVAQANPISSPPYFFFGEESASLILLVYFNWLIVGAGLKLAKFDLTHFRLAGYAITCLCLYIFQPDLGLLIWIVFVGLLVAYYLFPRAEVPRRSRVLNLSFHGFFFLAIIAASIAANIYHYWENGGYRVWRRNMREYYPISLAACMIVAVPVSAFIYFGVICPRRERSQPSASEPAAKPAPAHTTTKS